jgi:hypothetical protein
MRSAECGMKLEPPHVGCYECLQLCLQDWIDPMMIRQA